MGVPNGSSEAPSPPGPNSGELNDSDESWLATFHNRRSSASTQARVGRRGRDAEHDANFKALRVQAMCSDIRSSAVPASENMICGLCLHVMSHGCTGVHADNTARGADPVETEFSVSVPASVKCLDCPGMFQHLCTACDVKVHGTAPDHKRFGVSLEASLSFPLTVLQTYDGEDILPIAFKPIALDKMCIVCNNNEWSARPVTPEDLTESGMTKLSNFQPSSNTRNLMSVARGHRPIFLVGIAGKISLHHAVYECRSKICKQQWISYDPRTWFTEKYFPASAGIVQTVFATKVLAELVVRRKFNPGYSLRSFVQELNMNGSVFALFKVCRVLYQARVHDSLKYSVRPTA